MSSEYDAIVSKLTDKGYDEFDACECLHAWLSVNHGGLWSDTYSLLSQSKFNPGRFWSEDKVKEDMPELWEDIAEVINE